MFTSQKGVDALVPRLFAIVSSMPISRLMAFALAATAAVAAEVPVAPKPRSVWVVSITEENDKFAPKNKDRYYTQGLKVAVNRGDHTFFSLTQEINTPADTSNPNPSPDDMPYSGALYVGWGYGAILDRSGRRDCMFSVEAKVGVIGPSAGGATIQNKFHDLIGTPQAVGWGTQLPDELLLNLDGEFRRRFDLDPTGHGYRDLIARGVVELGTVRTEVVLGAQLRWGVNLDKSWGHSYIRHSNGYDPIDALKTPESRPNFSYWAFVDSQLEVVVRNYATDGTNFRESRGVTRSPIVLQCAVGATFQVYSCSATYFIAARTKEFETQDGVHFFGGLKGQFLF
jgi:lipid A 3-O-deacylase